MDMTVSTTGERSGIEQLAHMILLIGLCLVGLTAPPDGVRIQAGDYFGQATFERLQVWGERE